MIIQQKQLEDLRKKYRNKKIIFAGGVFDMFHTAHIRALKQLRSLGDIVVIGIVSDKRARERKGQSRPILNQKERMEIVDAIKYVDYAVLMSESTGKAPFPTLHILAKLRPDVFVTVDERWGKYKNAVAQYGVKLKIVKRLQKVSSTAIIERVVAQYRKK